MVTRHDKPLCDACEVRQTSILGCLSPEQVNDYTEKKSCNFYKKKQVIFYEGNRPMGLYCIYSGKIKIYKLGDAGREQIVRLATVGNIIGYRSLITGEPYTATAEALEDCMVCVIPASLVFESMEKNISLTNNMMSMLCNDLGQAENRMVNMTQKSVRERLAEVLFMLKESFGTEEDNATLNVILTREDIASIVGTATESIIRLLSEFNKEKLIELNKKKIKILNPQGLADISRLYD